VEIINSVNIKFASSSTRPAEYSAVRQFIPQGTKIIHSIVRTKEAQEEDKGKKDPKYFARSTALVDDTSLKPFYFAISQYENNPNQIFIESNNDSKTLAIKYAESEINGEGTFVLGNTWFTFSNSKLSLMFENEWPMREI